MVKTYRKGYSAELELLHKLSLMGFVAIRAPRSGRINLPSPDIIAIKNGKMVAIECKARTKGFKISKDQINELKLWSEHGVDVYIGWKQLRKDWIFINLEDVINNNGGIEGLE